MDMSIKGVTKSMTFDLFLLHFFDGVVFYLYYSSYLSKKKKEYGFRYNSMEKKNTYSQH